MIDEKFDLFQSVMDELGRIRGRSEVLFTALNAEIGLSPIEMTVLNAVAGAASPPTVPRIGRGLGHPRQVIQRSANVLIEQGLIATAPNPDHKRALLLTLTPAGRGVKRKADAIARRLAEPIISALDIDALRAAVEALHAIRVSIDINVKPRPAGETRPPLLDGVQA